MQVMFSAWDTRETAKVSLNEVLVQAIGIVALGLNCQQELNHKNTCLLVLDFTLVFGVPKAFIFIGRINTQCSVI